jgi:hypothetical protein
MNKNNMTDLDKQSRLYAADRLLDTVDGIFHAQHIKQAYMDGYNAARKEFLLSELHSHKTKANLSHL